MQREVTFVTACDSLGNKTHYSLGRVLPGQRLGFLCSSFIGSVGDELVFLKRTYKMVSVHRLTTSTHPKHVEQLVKLAGIKTSGAMRKLPGHPQMDDVDNTPELEAHEASEFRSGVGILLYLAPDLPHAQHAIRHLGSGMSRPTQRIKDICKLSLFEFAICWWHIRLAPCYGGCYATLGVGCDDIRCA